MNNQPLRQITELRYSVYCIINKDFSQPENVALIGSIDYPRLARSKMEGGIGENNNEVRKVESAGIPDKADVCGVFSACLRSDAAG
ncbi:MAG: hypothetical protein HQK57_08415 [Deltaproteobacteria bacterium]|nr:hypothetical protein [Deltaproteobacteria bacterium]MBF0526868.1 hypothetical protein [Deltaproteobacteria bacterium]